MRRVHCLSVLIGKIPDAACLHKMKLKTARACTIGTCGDKTQWIVGHWQPVCKFHHCHHGNRGVVNLHHLHLCVLFSTNAIYDWNVADVCGHHSLCFFICYVRHSNPRSLWQSPKNKFYFINHLFLYFYHIFWRIWFNLTANIPQKNTNKHWYITRKSNLVYFLINKNK